MNVSPYVSFNGHCEEAFKFYEKCQIGKIESMFRYEGTPAATQIPAEWQSKIMHARLNAGGSLLMASDAPPGMYNKPTGFHVTLQPKDTAEAERLFHALADGGTVQMPIQQTFWAARFAMLVDRFGIPWMINCEASK